MLGKLPVPGRLAYLDKSRAGPTALAVGAGGVVWTFFSLVYPFSFLSPSLWVTARYRLKHCLKGPLSPKQLTNQLDMQFILVFFLLLLNIHIKQFGLGTQILNIKQCSKLTVANSKFALENPICHLLKI